MGEGRTQTYEEIADGIVAALARAGALRSPVAATPWDAFIRLSDRVHGSFETPATSFTPMMRRLLFALSFAARARAIVGVGTHVGYTFSWLLRDRHDRGAGPYLDSACGIDVDARANALARRNTAVLGHGRRLRFIDRDGAGSVARMRRAVDMLYLDLDDPGTGKAGYLDVLRAALPRLSPRALVLAHDPFVPRFAGDFAAYHRFVSDSPLFAGPWILKIDECGLSVAVRREGPP